MFSIASLWVKQGGQILCAFDCSVMLSLGEHSFQNVCTGPLFDRAEKASDVVKYIFQISYCSTISNSSISVLQDTQSQSDVKEGIQGQSVISYMSMNNTLILLSISIIARSIHLAIHQVFVNACLWVSHCEYDHCMKTPVLMVRTRFNMTAIFFYIQV